MRIFPSHVFQQFRSKKFQIFFRDLFWPKTGVRSFQGFARQDFIKLIQGINRKCNEIQDSEFSGQKVFVSVKVFGFKSLYFCRQRLADSSFAAKEFFCCIPGLVNEALQAFVGLAHVANP